MPKTKLNINQVEHEFVHGIWIVDDFGNKQLIYPTIKELAKKYECAEQTLYQHSSQENWKLKREQYKSKIEQYYDEQAQSERLALSTKYDTENIKNIERVTKLIDNYFKKYQPYFDRNAEVLDEEMPNIELKDLDYIMAILQKKHKLVRDIFDEYDSAEKNKFKQKQGNNLTDNIDNQKVDKDKIKEMTKQYLDVENKAEEISKEEEELQKILNE